MSNPLDDAVNAYTRKVGIKSDTFGIDNAPTHSALCSKPKDISTRDWKREALDQGTQKAHPQQDSYLLDTLKSLGKRKPSHSKRLRETITHSLESSPPAESRSVLDREVDG